MKLINNSLLAVLLALLFTGTAAAQKTTIYGKVTDAETGEGIPGVHVYLAETTIGAVTEPDGSFSFKTEVTGIYDLLFSFVGYKKKRKQIHIAERGENLKHEVELTPDVVALDEVEVTTDNREWMRNLNLFKEQFIGSSGFANDTKITNPWVLEFEIKDRSYLTATTLKPLIIENAALGYRLYIELENFRWKVSGEEGFYKIYPKFEEMEAESQRIQRQWERNRKIAYEGSFQHFLKSLYEENFRNEQFTLSNPSYLLILSREDTEFALMNRRDVSSSLSKNIKGYRLLNMIEVIYGAKSDYQTKKYGGASFDVTRSVLEPNTPQGLFFVDNTGNLLDPTSLKIAGEWAGKRLGYRLPLDYVLDQ